MKRRLAVLLIILVAVCLLGAYSVFIVAQKAKTPDVFSSRSSANPSNMNQVVVKDQLSPEEIMDIIKTDKDYNELLSFITGFDPEVVSYIKLDPNGYQIIKTQWQDQGLGERINMVDKLNLKDSTYWIELKNKADETKGLRMILDTKEKKSLLLIAALSVTAGIGI